MYAYFGVRLNTSCISVAKESRSPTEWTTETNETDETSIKSTQEKEMIMKKKDTKKKNVIKTTNWSTDTKRKFHNSLFLYNLLFTHMQNFSRISRLTGIHTTAHAHTQEKKEITFDTGRKSYII